MENSFAQLSTVDDDDDKENNDQTNLTAPKDAAPAMSQERPPFSAVPTTRRISSSWAEQTDEEERLVKNVRCTSQPIRPLDGLAKPSQLSPPLDTTWMAPKVTTKHRRHHEKKSSSSAPTSKPCYFQNTKKKCSNSAEKRADGSGWWPYCDVCFKQPGPKCSSTKCTNICYLRTSALGKFHHKCESCRAKSVARVPKIKPPTKGSIKKPSSCSSPSQSPTNTEKKATFLSNAFNVLTEDVDNDENDEKKNNSFIKNNNIFVKQMNRESCNHFFVVANNAIENCRRCGLEYHFNNEKKTEHIHLWEANIVSRFTSAISTKIIDDIDLSASLTKQPLEQYKCRLCSKLFDAN